MLCPPVTNTCMASGCFWVGLAEYKGVADWVHCIRSGRGMLCNDVHITCVTEADGRAFLVLHSHVHGIFCNAGTREHTFLKGTR